MIRLHCSSVEHEHAADPDSGPEEFTNLANLKNVQQNHVTLLQTLEKIIEKQSAHIVACERKIIDLNATLETFYSDKYDNVSLFETIDRISEELFQLNKRLTGIDDGIYHQKQNFEKLLDENFILRGFCQVEHKITSKAVSADCSEKDEAKNAEDLLQIIADRNNGKPTEDDLKEQIRVLNSQVLRLQSELTERLIKVDSLERDIEELQTMNDSLTDQLEQSEFKERKTHTRLMALLDESDQSKFKYERDIINCMNLVEEKQQKLSTTKSTLHIKEKEIQEMQISLQKFGEENDSLKQKIYDVNSELYQKVNELNDFHVEAEKDQERLEGELAKERAKVSQLSKNLKNRDEEIEFLEQEIMKKQEIDEKALLSEVQKLEKDRQHIIDNKHEQIQELRAKIDQLEEFNFSRRAFVDFEIEEAKLRERHMKLGLMNEILRNYIKRQSDQADMIHKDSTSEQKEVEGLSEDAKTIKKAHKHPGSLTQEDEKDLTQGYEKSPGVGPDTYLDSPMYWKLYEFIKRSEHFLMWILSRRDTINQVTQELASVETKSSLSQTKQGDSKRSGDEKSAARLVLRKEMKLTDPRVLLQTACELKKFFGHAFC